MKTTYYSVNAAAFQTTGILEARGANQHLPLPVLNAKMHQYALQNFVYGDRSDLWRDTFYEAAQFKQLEADAPIGSIQVRVDFNPNYGHDHPEDFDNKIPDWCNPQILWNSVAMALNHPNSWDHFPSPGVIDSIRIKVIVGPDQVSETTLWACLHEERITMSASADEDLTMGGKDWVVALVTNPDEVS